MKGELSLAHELLILPTYHIIVYTHAWKPLSNDVEIVSVLGKIFHTASPSFGEFPFMRSLILNDHSIEIEVFWPAVRVGPNPIASLFY